MLHSHPATRVPYHHRPDHAPPYRTRRRTRSEEHTSELQSQSNLVCRLLLEKKKQNSTHELSLRLLPAFSQPRLSPIPPDSFRPLLPLRSRSLRDDPSALTTL